jgi:peptidoglycan/xylan/chitin deacetylase (PgdA/CDA1 family)
MRSDALVQVRLTSIDPASRAAWAQGLRVSLPESMLDRVGWLRAIDANGDLAIAQPSAAITISDVADLRERCAFTDRPPLSARLPISYRYVPGWARAIAASAIGRWNRRRAGRWAGFPGWPIDLSADALNDLSDSTPATGLDAPTPVILTHDIDSAEGLINLLERFVPLEEAVGARSISYIVPCAWRLDHSLIGDLVARGHRVGVHGYDHSNTTPFAAAGERRRRLDAARGFADRYDATGYRAPSLLRTRALLKDLSTRYLYDSSIPTSGGLFPVPNNGCATARPFVIEGIVGIVELPLTMPRDGSLRFLGYSPDEIAQMWIDCADTIASSRGVVVLLTHCERRFSGHPGMIEAYRRFLQFVRDRPNRFVFSNPEDAIERATRHQASPATDASKRTVRA